MRFGQRDIDWEMVGAELARATDSEQATMIRGFLNELVKACGTDLAAERQLAFVSNKLTNAEHNLLTMLSTGGTDGKD